MPSLLGCQCCFSDASRTPFLGAKAMVTCCAHAGLLGLEKGAFPASSARPPRRRCHPTGLGRHPYPEGLQLLLGEVG